MNNLRSKASWLIGVGMLVSGLLVAAPCQASFVSTLDLESDGVKQQRVGQDRPLADKLAALGFSQEEIAVHVSDVEQTSGFVSEQTDRPDQLMTAERAGQVIGR